jgi:hypothetical protein
VSLALFHELTHFIHSYPFALFPLSSGTIGAFLGHLSLVAAEDARVEVSKCSVSILLIATIVEGNVTVPPPDTPTLYGTIDPRPAHPSKIATLRHYAQARSIVCCCCSATTRYNCPYTLIISTTASKSASPPSISLHHTFCPSLSFFAFFPSLGPPRVASPLPVCIHPLKAPHTTRLTLTCWLAPRCTSGVACSCIKLQVHFSSGGEQHSCSKLPALPLPLSPTLLSLSALRFPAVHPLTEPNSRSRLASP